MSKSETTLTIRLDKDFHREIKVFAAQQGITIKELFLRGVALVIAETDHKWSKKTAPVGAPTPTEA